MGSIQRSKIMIALFAAYEYGLLANHAAKEDRADYEKLMLNRLQHAVENAGYRMEPATTEKAKAA